MNSQNFRRHPGGIYSVIKSFKLLLLFGILGGSVAVIVGLFSMFNNRISIYVTGSGDKMADISNQAFVISNIKTFGLLKFEARNAIEWLFLPRYSDFDVFVHAISLLISWQLYQIIKEINLENPFYEGILKRIKTIYLSVFCGFIFITLRHLYVLYVVNDVTHAGFQSLRTSFLSSDGYLSLGTWLIVYLFAHVYKKGLSLQSYNDLTI